MQKIILSRGNFLEKELGDYKIINLFVDKMIVEMYAKIERGYGLLEYLYVLDEN
jgi:hypothetical protein